MIHIPALRLGKPYVSMDKNTLVHHVTGEPVAQVSQVTGSMLARDAAKFATARQELARIPMRELLAMCKVAGDYFLNDTLPLGDGQQSFDDYLRSLSATTGSPLVFCKRNAEKVAFVLSNMETVLGGLTRGLDPDVFDRGHGKQDGRTQSFYPVSDSFGAVLPSNSPGVHSLWVPAIALKTPLVLKPGREEPWTPYRVLQAYLKAGVPAAALNFYPTDHAGAADLLRVCGRSMLFGDSSTTDAYKNDHRVELHGPGFSKVIFGADAVENWRDHLDLVAECVAANGGRSCINVSAVWTPKYGREIADALAEKLAKVKARAWDDPAAELAAFGKPEVAEAINAMVDTGLLMPGATDLTEKHRGSPRLVRDGRCAWLLPTVVLCDSWEHPLANKEFLFPYASVVECPQDQMLRHIGPTLAVMALTEDPAFARQLLDCPRVERLNLGPIPTNRLTWDQPHEGNLFTHLYRQRAFQSAGRVAAAV